MLLRPVVAVALSALATASIAAPLPVEPPFSSEQRSTWDDINEILNLLDGRSTPSHGNDFSGNLVHQGNYHAPNAAAHNVHAAQAPQEPSAFGLDYHPLGPNNMLHPANLGQGPSPTSFHHPMVAHRSPYGGGGTGGFEPNHAAYTLPAGQGKQEPSDFGWDQHVQNNMLHHGNFGQGASSTTLHNSMVAHTSPYGGGATGGRQATHDASDPFVAMQRTYNHRAPDDWSLNALFRYAKPSGSKSLAVDNTASHPFSQQREAGASRTGWGSSANLQQVPSRHQLPAFAADPQEPAEQAHLESSPRQDEPALQKSARKVVGALENLKMKTLDTLKVMMDKSLEAYSDRQEYIEQVHWNKKFDPENGNVKKAMAVMSTKIARINTLKPTEEWDVLRRSPEHMFTVENYRIAVQKVRHFEMGWRDFRLLAFDPAHNTFEYLGAVRVPDAIALDPDYINGNRLAALGYVSSKSRVSAEGGGSSKPERKIKQRRS
ncbi:hypothetical protein ACQY0O_005631 [Thecaphora frezii]